MKDPQLQGQAKQQWDRLMSRLESDVKVGGYKEDLRNMTNAELDEANDDDSR